VSKPTDGPRLGIDAHRLLGSQTGVARYLSALLHEWADGEHPFGEVVLYVPRPLPPDVLPREHSYYVRVLPARGPLGLWHHITLARAARETDVLFCPAFIAPLAYRGPFVVTIHDTAHENVGRSFAWRTRYHARLYRNSARRARLVLADSVSAQEDVERVYGVNPSRIRYVPLGVSAPVTGATAESERDARERFGLGDGPLVLFVGKFSQRRNVPTLVRAFARARQQAEEDWTLVLAGPNHLGLPIAELGEELGLGASLCLPGFVTDEQLAALYRAAEVFVLPSDYEGTSLTVPEAMAAGTAVITGGHSGLREVARDAALLLPTITEDNLTAALGSLMGDPALRAEYAERGLRRAAEFSWDHTAAETLSALAEVAGAPSAVTAGRR
jgi:glycosyltransferase involved in cell wall biosynthesis